MSGFRARPREVSRGGADSTGDPATVKRRRGRPSGRRRRPGPSHPLLRPTLPHPTDLRPAIAASACSIQPATLRDARPAGRPVAVVPRPLPLHPQTVGRTHPRGAVPERRPRCDERGGHRASRTPACGSPSRHPGCPRNDGRVRPSPALRPPHREVARHRAGRGAGTRAVRSAASPAVRSPWRSRVGAAASSARARSASAQRTVTSHQTDPTVE